MQSLVRVALSLAVIVSALVFSSAPAQPAAAGSGYWMISANGQVYAFGAAAQLGQPLGGARSDIEATPTGGGYWVLAEDGAVFTYGDARYFGRPTVPGRYVSMSATPSGAGYWIFTDTGRALAFGDAAHHGDLNGIRLNGPVLDSVATPSGLGYWMVASDGGIFSFGDAKFSGSTGGMRLNKPVMSMAPDPDGTGYWLVASDGGIFAFAAPFYGSMGATRLNKPISGMVTGPAGYLMVAEDGGIFAFGDVAFHGSLGSNPPASPVVAVAVMTGDGGGAAALVNGLRRSPEAARTGYDRELFDHWIAVGDGCDTRDAVLIAESIVPIPEPGSGCTYSGQWFSTYDGITTTDPSTFDVDHVVALAEAWDSGAYIWDANRRRDFANDLGADASLIAVSASSNRSKSDADPAEWLPPRVEARCAFATAWVQTKVRWDLSADDAEIAALRQTLSGCGSASSPSLNPTTTTTTTGAYYANCAAARNAGAAPIYRGEPGYRPALDGDNDGVACE